MNGRVNNGEAGDFRHHRAHYDVTVMQYIFLGSTEWRNGAEWRIRISTVPLSVIL